MQISEKGRVALQLAGRGWYVFPLWPGSKIPMPKDWENVATDDLVAVSEEWLNTPDANIGIATGPSNLVVVDFDTAKDGEQDSGILNFQRAYPGKKLLATYTVRTPTGGWHLYYNAPAEPIRNSAGKLAEKVDTRAQGGYVVAAGSTINGAYEVHGNAPMELPNLPNWLFELLKEQSVKHSDIVPKGEATVYAMAALKSECGKLAETTEGGRNHATNRAAWNLSRFVAKGELDYDLTFDSVRQAAMVSGLSEREARAATKSGLSRGIGHYGRNESSIREASFDHGHCP